MIAASTVAVPLATIAARDGRARQRFGDEVNTVLQRRGLPYLCRRDYFLEKRSLQRARHGQQKLIAAAEPAFIEPILIRPICIQTPRRLQNRWQVHADFLAAACLASA